MNKLVLKVPGEVFSADGEEPKEKFKELMKLEKHFRTIDIKSYEDSKKSQLMSVIDKHGVGLISCRLNVHFLRSQVLLNLLRLSPDLEELSLYIRDQIDCTYISTQEKSLKKLTKMEICGDLRAFQFFEAPELEELKVDPLYKELDVEYLEIFLKASNKLKLLEMDYSAFNSMNSTFNFKLKRIICKSGIRFEENCKNFFLSQAETVEKLEARSNNPEFYEMVFTKFKKLRNLKTNFNSVIMPSEFSLKMKLLPSLKEIETVKFFTPDSAVRAFFKNLPELVMFKCHFDTNLPNHLDFIAAHNMKLEDLTITTIRATEAKFQHLKKFSLSYIEDFGSLVAFLKANPTVEFFRSSLTELDVECEHLGTLINETSIKHVYIHGYTPAKTAFYEKIKNGSGTWKTLYLGNYKFDFPGDPANWKLPKNLYDNDYIMYPDKAWDRFCKQMIT